MCVSGIRSGDRFLSFKRPVIMGILNVTPDSFSDGGLWRECGRAYDHAAKMLEEGAQVIDVGGESTRPGASDVGVDEEMDRVVPVVEKIARNLDVMISVDTSRPEVIRAAVEAGAHVWNDIRALRLDGAVEEAARLDIPVILMHMQGRPRTMQVAPHYADVVREVADFLLDRAKAAMDAGVRKENIILDPGFGFGKSAEDNYRLLDRLQDLVALGYPVLSALSRKSMLGAATGIKKASDRVVSSVAGHLISIMKGAVMVRVHDVAPTKEAIDVYNAMTASRQRS
jgi:dihydropteroate synthase